MFILLVVTLDSPVALDGNSTLLVALEQAIKNDTFNNAEILQSVFYPPGDNSPNTVSISCNISVQRIIENVLPFNSSPAFECDNFGRDCISIFWSFTISQTFDTYTLLDYMNSGVMNYMRTIDYLSWIIFSAFTHSPSNHRPVSYQFYELPESDVINLSLGELQKAPSYDEFLFNMKLLLSWV